MNGDPVRSEDQNPVENPALYWPYVLPLRPVLTALNDPSNFTASVSSNLDAITLTWTDRSNYEDGYKIQRRTPDSNWTTIATLASNATSFTDNSVDPFFDYQYRIWAFGDGITSDTVYLNVTTDAVVQEGVSHNYTRLPLQLAYNGGNLHMVYRSSNGDIFYKYSTDDGYTWSSPTYIGHGNRPTIAAAEGYISVLWDSAGYILYRYSTGQSFSQTYRFKPGGTHINVYSPVVEMSNDTARVAFGANNDHAYFVFYKEFPVVAPPSGIISCDTVWVYPHHLDTLTVRGIASYSNGESRYVGISFWSYGFVGYSYWGSLAYFYERPLGSDTWQDGLTTGYGATYSGALDISNPVIDKATGTLFVGFGLPSDLMDIWAKNVETGYDTSIIYLQAPEGDGPFYIAHNRKTVMMTYNSTDHTRTELLVTVKVTNSGWQMHQIPLSFAPLPVAGIAIKRTGSITAEEYYHVMLPLDRGNNDNLTRTFKNKLAYTYIYEQSPLEGEETDNAPSEFGIEVLNNPVKSEGIVTVKLNLPSRRDVTLEIYDLAGREAVKLQKTYGKGIHIESIKIGLASGVYFLRADMGDKVITRKFLVLK